MNASRAQLVRETIRPGLAAGEIILADRYYDSTTAYQGYGRGLPMDFVKSVIDFAVGDTRPQRTLFLKVPAAVRAERLRSRQATLPFVRDRIEEADREFFARVERGFDSIAVAEPARVCVLDASGSPDEVAAVIWEKIHPLLGSR